MRKSYLFLFLLSLMTLLFFVGKSDTYAACGGSWYSTSCPTSPYDCKGPKCGIDQGIGDMKRAIGPWITDKPIAQYAQDILRYFMGFISLIAVIYIIYGGFQMMIGAGDEEKMKKTRQIITYVIIGMIIMWLAYPIVKWTTTLLTSQNIVPQAIAAYTESEADTFTEYKDKIREGVSKMESELILNKSVNVATIQNVKNLVQAGYDRLPDFGESASVNREAKQVVDTYLNLAMQNPTNSNHVGNAISRVSSFLDRANIGKITGDISAGPAEGNAPLSVSFSADNVKDPSGTTPGDNNYIWWTRENGGYRRELSRGPSLSYTFTKEGTYTVFLDVVSGNRNSKGKTDVLPLSTSKQITVKPKLGEIVLLINGVNVSNMDKIKISPTIGNMGVILDASASRAIGNGTIAETSWEFGNGESSTNKGSPIIERQLYANEGGYQVKLTMKTNDGKTFTKDLQLLVLDAAATIKLDKTTGHIGEDISMTAASYFSDNKNVEYNWQIQDENGNKLVKSGEGSSFKYKFDKVGIYIVSLTTKSPNGKVDTDSKTITIESREPVVSIDAPKPIKSERPNTIVFDASKSYDPDSNSRKNLSYTWKIDGEKVTLDNQENDGAKGTFTFDTKGSHKASVTVANVYGKITTTESQFDVTSTLSIGMITTPKVVKINEPVTVIGQSSNAEFFEWNMGDGSSPVNGANRTVQHIYKQAGTYDVRLNVTRDGGSEVNSITRKIYVTNADSPFALIDASNSSNSIIEEEGVCGDNKALIINRADMTTFNASNSVNIDGTTTGLSYTWKYFGKARTTQSITEKFNELGCFPIELTVRSNKNGATHTSTQYIKLTNQPPELTNLTTSIDATKKDSQKILVKVKANGVRDPDGVITSYIWYFKTESDPEPQNVQITQKDEITFVLPNITEKYYFGVILEDNDGARIDTTESGKSPTPLIVDNSNGNINLPLITLTTPKTVINIGEKALFSVDVKTIIPGVNITNKSEYAWDFDGDGRIDEKSSTPSIEHVYARSGDFNMKVRVTNNGVSNSKYQTIHVKNKLTANATAYKMPDGKIYLLNSSEGSYNKTHWEIGNIVSESLSSVVIDDNGSLSGKITVSSNDTDVSTQDINFSNPIPMSGTGIVYQSFPQSNNDVITVKNPSDTILLSMLGNTATNYSIDTDILIDTNLDGTQDNDSDNKDDVSYTDGSVYSMYNIGTSPKRERKIRLALMNNRVVSDSKIITVILDYIPGAVEENINLSGSGIEGLTDSDRKKLEELSKMIRELTDSDRIILMQRYNTLVENWNNPFDKAKSLIDIQEGIEGSSIDSEKQGKMSKVVDELLIGDAEVTDEIGIAALLIRDLIPAESPNHDTLLAKLVEIESHPTLLEANKKLGKDMLILIEGDTTIPDKYKLHIKNQLLIIINGGSKSVESTSSGTTTTVQEDTAPSGILGFLSGFVKIFFIIIGIVFFIGIAAFIVYRITRKGDTIGFQDFLIDSVFHSKSTPPPVSDTIGHSDTVINGAPPLPKEDPLSSYTPVVEQKKVSFVAEKIPSIEEKPSIADPLTSFIPETSVEKVADTVLPTETIPDWLKVPSNLESTVPSIPKEAEPILANVTEEAQVIQEEAPVIKTETENSGDSAHDDAIPDWLKSVQAAPVNIPEVPTDEVPVSSAEKTPNTTDSDKLPDWLINSLQSEEEKITPENIEETITPTSVEPVQESILDLVESTPLEETPEIQEIPKKEAPSPKKPVKKIKNTEKKETVTPPPATENTSIPDWLK